MLKLLQSIIHSTPFKLLVRFVASLASAIIVISGILFFINRSIKGKDEEKKALRDMANNDEEETAGNAESSY